MFLDIAIGILISLVASKIFVLDLNATLVFGAIIMAIFPDLDFLLTTLEYGYIGKYAHNHRNLLHFPMVYLLLFGLLVLLFFGTSWLFVFICASIWHFIHDSFGLGWGVAWFFPFSRRNYKFFTDEQNHFSKKFIISWNQKELNAAVEKYGDPNWFKNIYFRFSPTLIIEISAFFIAIIILLYYLNII